MSGEFTPGPWEAIEHPKDWVIKQRVSTFSGTTFPAFVARVERTANARMIAAAPDLLAALEAAVACGMVPVTSAKEGGASKYSAQVDAADMIRAAIAKARGETQ